MTILDEIIQINSQQSSHRADCDCEPDRPELLIEGFECEGCREKKAARVNELSLEIARKRRRRSRKSGSTSTSLTFSEVVRKWGTRKEMTRYIQRFTLSALRHLTGKTLARMNAAERDEYKNTWKKIKSKLFAERRKLIMGGFIPPLGLPKIPFGFKKKRRGLDNKYNDMPPSARLDSTLETLHRRGKIELTQNQLDIFQRIANVETSGKIQTLNTWDSGVVSIGFMQLTLHTGKIQHWISRAPLAFKKYGIEVGEGSYRFRTTGKQPAIKGVPRRKMNELRWNGWAERFYYAGLDPDIIAAEVEVAKFFLRRHLEDLKRRLEKIRRWRKLKVFETFKGHYYPKDPYIRGLFHASYNNHPANATRAVKAAVRAFRRHPVSTTDFITRYQKELKRRGWYGLVRKTAIGTSIEL